LLGWQKGDPEVKSSKPFLDRDRAAEADAATRPGRNSTIKTILLHVQNDLSWKVRVQAGLALARACSAHLSCVHTIPFEAHLFSTDAVIKAIDEEETQLRIRLEEDLRNEDVSWDYSQVTGSVARILAGDGALADLIVTGRDEHSRRFGGPPITIIGDILHSSRTPLFLPGDEKQQFDPTGTALIAWDGGFEAANAVRASIGLLKVASEVRVVQINEKAKEESFPHTRLLEYLSRHDIHADLHVESKRGRMDHQMVSALLLTHARTVSAAYMVLGGYSQSRIGQYVFGGVTRSLLSASTVPLVIAR
jgi:hypothetical protein